MLLLEGHEHQACDSSSSSSSGTERSTVEFATHTYAAIVHADGFVGGMFVLHSSFEAVQATLNWCKTYCNLLPAPYSTTILLLLLNADHIYTH